MEKFIKTPGRDPFIKFESDSAIAMFGHLNALVDAITILQETGGGGGGNPISVWQDLDEKTSNLSKLTFTGDVSVTQTSLGQILVDIPAFNINTDINANDISLSKLQQISSQTLLGRYQAGTGNIQSITLGSGLSLNNTGVLSATSSTYTGTSNQIDVSGSNVISLAVLSPAVSSGPYGEGGDSTTNASVPVITLDNKGRVTAAISETITKVALTQQSTSSFAPTNANDIANKSYVDTFVQGLSPKESVRLATTAPITLLGFPILDGVQVQNLNRILVKDQNIPSQNGIYIATSSTWNRAADMSDWPEVPAAFVFVEEGTNNKDLAFVCTSDAGGTINVTPINWVKFSSGTTYTSGTGINISSLNTINIADISGLPSTQTGSSTNIPQLTVNGQGQVTALTSTAAVIPIGPGSTNITGTLSPGNGGTGLNSYGVGSILYATNSTTLAALAGGVANNGKVLTVVSGLPSWQPAPDTFDNPMDAAGQMLYSSDSTGTLAKVPVGLNNQVLTYDTANNKPKWADAQGSNPTTDRGDIIFCSATANPGTLDNLAIGTTGQYLRVNNTGGVLLPKWENGVTTGAVVSFVIDGYGAPIVAPSATTVFKVKIPYTGTFTTLDTESNVLPGTGTAQVTANTLTSTISTNVNGAQTGTAFNVSAGSFVTFTVTNGSSSNVSRIFVNLTGTRS